MAAKFSIPFPITSVLSDLATLVGENLVGCPRQIEIREPDGGPAGAENGATWRQVVDAWRPGLYIRAYALGIVDRNYGDGVGLIGARLRFTSRIEAAGAWWRMTAAWERRRNDDSLRHPIMGALIRNWGPERPLWEARAELWVVDRRGLCWSRGHAEIPEVWRPHIPAEIRHLAEQMPEGVCTSEL